jgi:hypothetical protein
MTTALTCRRTALALVACGLWACTGDFESPFATDGAVPDPGAGQNVAANLACLECHGTITPRWQLPSSHGVLLDCTHCHGTRGASGPGHSDSRACADCHSQTTHPAGTACTNCHDPHGAENAFLVRETLKVRGRDEVPVHFTTVEGASADGLVRAGVEGAQPGTGLCEVCHTATRYYPRSGLGEPHETGWCPRCHLHENGFWLGRP